MADNIANEQIRDTNTYTYETQFALSDRDKGVFQYVNNLDTEISVTVYGTHDEDTDFSEAVTLTSQFSIASASTDRDALTEPWDRVRFEVVASSTPTSGEIKIFRHE